MFKPPAPSTAPMHLIWDWNGTLLDDLPMMVTASNACLAAIGEGPIDAGTYRQEHCLPLRRFYDRLCARPVSDDEWSTIQHVYAHYPQYPTLPHSALEQPPVRTGTPNLLAWVASRACTQSLLSLTADRRLHREVERAHLHGFFRRIDGGQEGDTHKATALRRHLAALGEPDRRRVVMIGDTTDDAAAARACGIRAILHTGGFQTAEQLRTTGAPVVTGIDAAARLGVNPATPPPPPPALLGLTALPNTPHQR